MEITHWNVPNEPHRGACGVNEPARLLLFTRQSLSYPMLEMIGCAACQRLAKALMLRVDDP